MDEVELFLNKRPKIKNNLTALLQYMQHIKTPNVRIKLHTNPENTRDKTLLVLFGKGMDYSKARIIRDKIDKEFILPKNIDTKLLLPEIDPYA